MTGKPRSNVSVLETHVIRIAVTSEPECCLTLRMVEQFCEAMRTAGAEGAHEVILGANKADGVDTLTATVDQRNMPQAREV